MRNNRNLKRLCAALGLGRRDVAEITGVSGSRADGWLRAPVATKNATGTSRADTVRRFRQMTDAEFDEFCDGLADWYNDRDPDVDA